MSKLDPIALATMILIILLAGLAGYVIAEGPL